METEAGCKRGGGAASEGPGGQRYKLGPHLLARLAAMLDAGPAAYGWDEGRRGDSSPAT